MKARLFAAALAALALPAAAEPTVGKPGFVGLTQREGAWYFTAPDGKPFLSRGVDVVLPFDTAAKPGAVRYDGLAGGVSLDQWAKTTAERLALWNFDTVANWSHPAMAGKGLYTVETLAARIEQNKKLVDVFSSQFENEVREQARRVCAPRSGDKLLIGYFLENEQPWYGDFGWPTGHESTFLDRYLAFPSGSAGKLAVAGYFQREYGTVEAFNRIYGTALTRWDDFEKLGSLSARAKVMDKDRRGFLALAADRYYQVVATAIHGADPNHLVLGDRFANTAPREVIRACGRWCDVVSLNYYAGFLRVKPEYLRAFADLSGRPVLITEFSYRGTENRSGLKNTIGASVTVPTQKDRADHYGRYVTELARLPFIVGYHWFQYFDESPAGRYFDGEDSNYGLIDTSGRPYELLAATATAANALVAAVHATSGQTVIGPLSLGDEPVTVRRAEPAASARSFMGARPTAYGWGDAPHGGSVNISVSGAVSGRYSTGSGWGAGLSLVPDPATAPHGWADLSRYGSLELVITAPQGLRFSLLLSEEGAADPWATKFTGADGSDGESFASEEFTATGKEQIIVVGFDELTQRTSYGNQNGNRTIDLQAVHEIDLSLGGNQGSGTLTLKSLRVLP